MALPNFLGVGAEKAGTSPLFFILSQHRQIFMPSQKELHYFSLFHAWQPLESYEGYGFKEYRGQPAIGEITPEYMRFPEVPKRIFDALGPDVKLIFCLREPVQRAFSQYLMRCRLLEESESFETALTLEQRRIAENPYLGRRRAYVDGSRYAEQIRRFLELFPQDNMFFIIFETDFLLDRQTTIARLLEFLGVDPAEPLNLNVPNNSLSAPSVIAGLRDRDITLKWKTGELRLAAGDFFVHTGNASLDAGFVKASPRAAGHLAKLQDRMTRTLAPELARSLYDDCFAEEITRLEGLLGRDLSVWRHPLQPRSDPIEARSPAPGGQA
jgi:hypothetical protein